MGQVLIRNLDDETIAAYRELAARNHRSLEAELRHILQSFRPVTAERKAEALARLDSLRASTRGKPQTPSEVLIREIRDA